jgi:hypothetical protein
MRSISRIAFAVQILEKAEEPVLENGRVTQRSLFYLRSAFTPAGQQNRTITRWLMAILTDARARNGRVPAQGRLRFGLQSIWRRSPLRTLAARNTNNILGTVSAARAGKQLVCYL